MTLDVTPDPFARTRNALAADAPRDLGSPLRRIAEAFQRERQGRLTAAGKDMAARLRAQPALAVDLIDATYGLAPMIETYLLRIEGDLAAAPGNQRGPDSQISTVAGTLSAASAAAAGGHGKRETLGVAAAGFASRPRTAGLAVVQSTVAASLFDSVLIRGERIGDISFNRAQTMMRHGRRETAILKCVLAKAGSPSDPHAPLRDLVKVAVIEQALAKAGIKPASAASPAKAKPVKAESVKAVRA